MQDILSASLDKLHKIRVRRTRMIAILLVLSLVVSLDVFWWLRQPGLTLAGDADCGIVEHTHDSGCQGDESPCNLIEHIHDISCYSDENADAETQLYWQQMFVDYPYTGVLRSDLVGIAKTQVGYTESDLNFQVGSDGIRHGYNRYGAWYGTPYTNWSSLFVSFCLHYAGADEREFPINTGASSMAEQWRALGRYAAVGQYTPTSGDLVFFKDNTVGIVAEVQSASCYVIIGDVEDSVVGKLLQLTDESIAGWGNTGNNTSKVDLYDISNGPAFFIFADGSSNAKVRSYSLRNTRVTEEVNDLVEYLDKNEGHYFFTLMDLNNFEITKDNDGNYVVHAGTTYKLAMSCSSPNGFAPGTYQYKLPDGLTLINIDNAEAGELSGIFELGEGDNKVTVGSWSISTDGLITLMFNENMNDRSEVIISATMGVEFPLHDEPIDFDGKISVTVEKTRDEIFETEVRKWGVQGNEDNGKDHSKINWTVQIEGNEHSNLPGSLITDQIIKHDWSYEHFYGDDDIANGIHFGVSVIDPHEGAEYWHKWTVKQGDPNLQYWDADGWSYQLPETITCELCGIEMQLGNAYHTYFVEYTSTPVEVDVAGELGYSNTVNVDNKTQEGWAGFTQDAVNAAIFKNGKLVADANGAKIVWEVMATIPGKKEGEKADTYWSISDYMSIVDSQGNPVDSIANDMKLATVTANYYGTTINVPLIQNATEDDPYALVAYSWIEGFEDVRQFPILKRCECTADNCPKWNVEKGVCVCWGYEDDEGQWHPTSDYCDCWLEAEDTTFIFTYETNVTNAVGKHSNLGSLVRNRVALSNATGDYVNTNATVKIPQVVDKELEQDFGVVDNQIAKYKITVNESKLQLTDGSSFVIRDEMTSTLSFIRGSLVITTEDDEGNINTLHEGVDYVYEFYVPDKDSHDGSHNESQHVHVLEIEILHPQPVKYILDYDATIVIPPDASSTAVKYKNSVSVSLWKQKVTDTTVEKIYPDVNISSSTYGVKVIKKSAETGDNLSGAKIGIFNEAGYLITDGYTNNDGEIVFKTNVADGIVFREHVLYYVQELEAPPGYKLDDTKHWFCFCNTPDGTCSVFKDVVAGTNAFRVPYNTIGEINLTNEVLNYDLPATGGIGIYPLLFVSVIFVVTPLIYWFISRRKRERRGGVS